MKTTKILLVPCLWMLSSLIMADNSCYTAECHKEFNTIKIWHEPSQEDCTTCHEETDAEKHTFELTDTEKDLCYECHDNKETGELAHGPVASGECTSCHNPHGSDYEFFLPTKREDTMCYECHDVEFKDKEYVHGPMGPGKCSTCHNPHSSDNGYLLISSPKTICAECHTDRSFSGEGMNLHTELEDSGCSGCHDSHASDYKFQLLTPTEDLCAECHDDVVSDAAKAKNPHEIVQKGDKCLNCHSPHGSVYENNLLESPLDLCMNCHDKPIIGTDGKDYNIVKTLKKNPNKHGPINDGNCTGCHNPHGSDYFKLLVGNFPKEFYTPFAVEKYDLCFSCHDEEFVIFQKTNTMTNFRDGEINLHYLHVNKDKKGRTCRSCHEVHASRLPNHLRKEVPFGKWSIPINFEKSPTGGTCAPGCHKPKTYTR